MLRARRTIIRGGLATLYRSGAHRLLQPLFDGVGTILALHHVRPPRASAFAPNRLREITPEFLDQAITQLRQADVDFVSLDEMHRRLRAAEFKRHFVCLTFDGGYRDTKQYAYPILRRHDVPCAVYASPALVRRERCLWWVLLETVIAGAQWVEVDLGGGRRRLACHSVAEKERAYATICAAWRKLPGEADIDAAARALVERYGIDAAALCDAHCMTWCELAELSFDARVTIGAHALNHRALARLSEEEARAELREGRDMIRSQIGSPVDHVAYPDGDRDAAGAREFRLAAELGFKTGVTTRPGVVFAKHANHVTALPRVAVNGEYQDMRHLRVLMSGVATALRNGLRRVDAA